ncbi:MAG: acetoin dehydrogenase [Rhodospirillaceae bacterium]|nr:acetoin dehydrogenase [Rhodospirillaceae bacterium]
MHFDMLRIRRIEEAIATHYPEQEIRCPTHFCTGQEAVAAGVSAHLTEKDYAFSGHRSHGHYLAKGGDLKAMLCELYGKQDGCAAGRGGSQHLIDLDAGFVASAPILAGTLPIAVGSVYGHKEKGLDTVAVVYFGDGATEEGAFHESLNFASIKKLPVIFVCENNLYSVHSEFDVRQPLNRKISEFGKAHAMHSITADGNNVNTVWTHARDAIIKARNGEGPSLLEFMTYRWLEHCGPNEDTQLGYRTQQELEDWQEMCPIRRSAEHLIEIGLLDDSQILKIECQIKEEIDSAFSYAKTASFPDPTSLMQFTTPSCG